MEVNKAIRFLKPSVHYKVVKEFVDYDRELHTIGKNWVFDRLSYVAYHDGVCLHVIENDEKVMYRLMDIPGEQQSIIENFLDYVQEID